MLIITIIKLKKKTNKSFKAKMQKKEDINIDKNNQFPDDKYKNNDDFEVTAYKVSGKVDYDKLIDRFGTKKIDDELSMRLEKLSLGISGKPLHPFLKRRLFFSHRSLETVCETLERGEKVYLYTGRGPSSGSLHLGHLIPFMFSKYLQDAFDLPLVIQITDDEKFFCKNMSLEEASNMAIENIKDILSIGFDVKNTFIFCDTQYIGSMYPNICKIQKLININQIQKIFGFGLDDNIGKYSYVATQIAPSFSSSFPLILNNNNIDIKNDNNKKIEKCKNMKDKEEGILCLIPCAIDQDPFFRLTRDLAPRLGYKKPSIIHSKFFPSLLGPNDSGKMSSSEPNSAIFVNDSPKEIENKIKKYAFSGALKTLEEHKKFGANIDIDVSIQYLNVFLFDDEKLDKIKHDYKNGLIGTSDVKKLLITILIDICSDLQSKRSQITNDIIKQFTSPRLL